MVRLERQVTRFLAKRAILIMATYAIPMMGMGVVGYALSLLFPAANTVLVLRVAILMAVGGILVGTLVAIRSTRALARRIQEAEQSTASQHLHDQNMQ